MMTEQEDFWKGAFGDEYSKRNEVDVRVVATNIAYFSKVFAHAGRINSLIEFGANIGLNLRAINALLPEAELTAIELNTSAAAKLKAWGGCTVYEESILGFDSDLQWDMTLVKTLLIHINPDRLADVYKRLYERSSRFICICEYYNPTPLAISYRGHANKLFKRDFAGELLDSYPDLRLVDYGFFYHRDTLSPQDDVTWFLLEKDHS